MTWRPAMKHGEARRWRLVVKPKIEAFLRSLPPETKRYIRASFEEIRKDPRIGKPLRDELAGFYSFRTRRFRIVYKIERHVITVVVVGVGPRRTIYEELTAEILPSFQLRSEKPR